MRPRPRILLVGTRWSHMGGHSGLLPLGAALAKHADVERIAPSRGDRLRLLANKVQSRLKPGSSWNPAKAWTPYHDWPKALIETAAMRQAASGAYDWVIFEGVEDCFARFGTLKARLPKTKLLGVTHQPPAWWRLMVPEPDALNAFDALVALSRDAVDYLGKATDVTNLRFLRHGVDSAFFSPAPRTLPPANGLADILFCGQWLRDFDVLETFVRDSRRGARELRFHIVLPRSSRTIEKHYRLACHDNVFWYSGISDDALRNLYRTSHLMLLPLIDATANNSLLEAMACGLPILASRTGGVLDYADQSTVTFIDDDGARPPLEQLESCLADYAGGLEKAERARARMVAECNWDGFVAELMDMMNTSSPRIGS